MIFFFQGFYLLPKTLFLYHRESVCAGKGFLQFIKHTGTVQLRIIICHAVYTLGIILHLDDQFLINRQIIYLRCNLFRLQSK